MSFLDVLPRLDFLTIYVMIAVIGIALSAVWGAVCWQHRSFISARVWFVGCIAQAAGGLLLPFQIGNLAAPVASLAFGLIVFGFWLLWSGVRGFYGRDLRIKTAVGASALCSLLTVILFDNKEHLAILYAAGQIVPQVALLRLFLKTRGRSIGALIGCAGLFIGLTSHVIVVVMNIVILAGSGPVPDWFALAALTMVGAVMCGLLLNFGLAVMTIDHLREELAILANTESLTGLLNRRGFEDNAKGALMLAAGPASMVLCDLDHFKSVNDRFGHTAGDTVLREFSEILRSHLRSVDICGRVGGEEFAILFPGLSLSEARKRVGDLRKRLNQTEFKSRGEVFSVTASFGISERLKGEPYEVLFSRTDRLLYAAKDSGRDRIFSGIAGLSQTVNGPEDEIRTHDTVTSLLP
ncbi:GGDEF domain-containing protein [Aureimonas fodinaquatilis]|uniref:diguanylate cyclase n=1 Tax=Aureimonas fodinaquatilis TaxID=2565783 RepID=A0A5B0DWN7_9HYPH|nr:GGDEF domain-containing protein [Aureimonas fodinaquatilis]KAA0970275.1 GGDEF domain-containing protein [Aureimonas fodinaquatilis]